AHHPAFFGQWLVAIELLAKPPVEIAIVGALEDAATQALLARVRPGFRPSQVVAAAADPGSSAVPLLQGRFALNGRPTAFVRRGTRRAGPRHWNGAYTSPAGARSRRRQARRRAPDLAGHDRCPANVRAARVSARAGSRLGVPARVDADRLRPGPRQPLGGSRP